MTPPQTGTRGRRIKPEFEDSTPINIGGVDIVPTIISADMLDHGLNSGDDLYAWGNRHSSHDLSGKLRTGFVFVKYDEVKKLLADKGRPIILYTQDENGNLVYGTELVLMRGSKAVQNELIRRALSQQDSLVADASVREMKSQIDDLLTRTPVKKGQRVSLSADEDHGSRQPITLDT